VSKKFPLTKGRLPPEFRTRRIVDIMLMRHIIDFMGSWKECRPACRRAKGCASPTVVCFDLNRDAIREHLEAMAAWRRLEGPREPEEENAPVTELFD
jgi:hypothetical protein